MKYSLLIILIGFAVVGRSQIVNSTNSNENTNNAIFNNTSVEEAEPQVDTTVVVPSAEKEEIQSDKKRSTKLKAASAEGYRSSPVSDDEMDAQPSIQVQSVSYGSMFEKSKSQSDLMRTQRTPTPQQQVEMNNAVNFFETNAPNTFEYHYFKYTSGNYNLDLVDHLNAAETLRPNSADVHVQKAAYYVISEEVDSALFYMDKLENSGRISKSAELYAGDLLRSAPDSSTLITHGFDDTYAAWTVQNSTHLREDVTIVSLDFLQSPQYRENLELKGFELPKDTVINVDYLAELCTLNQEKDISISMTTPKEYLLPLQDKLYVAGLVFEYHSVPYENFSRNEDLWENGLEKSLLESGVDEKGRQLSANYLPMLLQLRKVYMQQGNEMKLEEIDEETDKVGVQCRKYEQVKKIKGSY